MEDIVSCASAYREKKCTMYFFQSQAYLQRQRRLLLYANGRQYICNSLDLQRASKKCQIESHSSRNQNNLLKVKFNEIYF